MDTLLWNGDIASFREFSSHPYLHGAYLGESWLDVFAPNGRVRAGLGDTIGQDSEGNIYVNRVGVVVCETGIEAGIRYTHGYLVYLDTGGSIADFGELPCWTDHELRSEAVLVRDIPKIGDKLADLWTGEDTRLARAAGLGSAALDR